MLQPDIDNRVMLISSNSDDDFIMKILSKVDVCQLYPKLGVDGIHSADVTRVMLVTGMFMESRLIDAIKKDPLAKAFFPKHLPKPTFVEVINHFGQLDPPSKHVAMIIQALLAAHFADHLKIASAGAIAAAWARLNRTNIYVSINPPFDGKKVYFICHGWPVEFFTQPPLFKTELVAILNSVIPFYPDLRACLDLNYFMENFRQLTGLMSDNVMAAIAIPLLKIPNQMPFTVTTGTGVKRKPNAATMLFSPNTSDKVKKTTLNKDIQCRYKITFSAGFPVRLHLAVVATGPTEYDLNGVYCQLHHHVTTTLGFPAVLVAHDAKWSYNAKSDYGPKAPDKIENLVVPMISIYAEQIEDLKLLQAKFGICQLTPEVLDQQAATGKQFVRALELSPGRSVQVACSVNSHMNRKSVPQIMRPHGFMYTNINPVHYPYIWEMQRTHSTHHAANAVIAVMVAPCPDFHAKNISTDRIAFLFITDGSTASFPDPPAGVRDLAAVVKGHPVLVGSVAYSVTGKVPFPRGLDPRHFLLDDKKVNMWSVPNWLSAADIAKATDELAMKEAKQDGFTPVRGRRRDEGQPHSTVHLGGPRPATNRFQFLSGQEDDELHPLAHAAVDEALSRRTHQLSDSMFDNESFPSLHQHQSPAPVPAARITSSRAWHNILAPVPLPDHHAVDVTVTPVSSLRTVSVAALTVETRIDTTILQLLALTPAFSTPPVIAEPLNQGPVAAEYDREPRPAVIDPSPALAHSPIAQLLVLAAEASSGILAEHATHQHAGSNEVPRSSGSQSTSCSLHNSAILSQDTDACMDQEVDPLEALLTRRRDRATRPEHESLPVEEVLCTQEHGSEHLMQLEDMRLEDNPSSYSSTSLRAQGRDYSGYDSDSGTTDVHSNTTSLEPDLFDSDNDLISRLAARLGHSAAHIEALLTQPGITTLLDSLVATVAVSPVHQAAVALCDVTLPVHHRLSHRSQVPQTSPVAGRIISSIFQTKRSAVKRTVLVSHASGAAKGKLNLAKVKFLQRHLSFLSFDTRERLRSRVNLQSNSPSHGRETFSPSSVSPLPFPLQSDVSLETFQAQSDTSLLAAASQHAVSSQAAADLLADSQQLVGTLFEVATDPSALPPPKESVLQQPVSQQLLPIRQDEVPSLTPCRPDSQQLRSQSPITRVVDDRQLCSQQQTVAPQLPGSVQLNSQVGSLCPDQLNLQSVGHTDSLTRPQQSDAPSVVFPSADISQVNGLQEVSSLPATSEAEVRNQCSVDHTTSHSSDTVVDTLQLAAHPQTCLVLTPDPSPGEEAGPRAMVTTSVWDDSSKATNQTAATTQTSQLCITDPSAPPDDSVQQPLSSSVHPPDSVQMLNLISSTDVATSEHPLSDNLDMDVVSQASVDPPPLFQVFTQPTTRQSPRLKVSRPKLLPLMARYQNVKVVADTTLSTDSTMVKKTTTSLASQVRSTTSPHTPPSST